MLQSMYVEAEQEPREAATAEVQEQRQQRALVLCGRAHDLTSWVMADRLVKAWGCGGCVRFGVRRPNR